MPEDEAALLRERMAAGVELDSTLLLADPSAQPMTGKVMFVDTRSNPRPGTVRARVVGERGRAARARAIRTRARRGTGARGRGHRARRAIMSSRSEVLPWVLGNGEGTEMRARA